LRIGIGDMGHQRVSEYTIDTSYAPVLSVPFALELSYSDVA